MLIVWLLTMHKKFAFYCTDLLWKSFRNLAEKGYKFVKQTFEIDVPHKFKQTVKEVHKMYLLNIVQKNVWY